MIQRQLKLRLTKKQDEQLSFWLLQCGSVFNWASRKIEQDAKQGFYYSPMGFQNLLADRSKKAGIPSHTMKAMLVQAHTAWQRCFKKLSKKPRLKGVRNKLNSVPFPDPIKSIGDGKVKLPGLGQVRYHKQGLPEGKVKCGSVIKRASGWYLSVIIDAEPNIAKTFHKTGDDVIGIDPGFSSLLTLSSGKKYDAAKEYAKIEKRLAQAQRGKDKKLAARLQERAAKRKRDRNHKISRELVEQCAVIAFSKDNIRGIKKRFGKSVANANHGQLRQFLAYKSSICGRSYMEVASKNSTRACSACGCLSGPTGLAGLSVRDWVCEECGTPHDRDINAAVNVLNAALGRSVESGVRYA